MSSVGLAEAVHVAARTLDDGAAGVAGCGSQLVRIFGDVAGVTYWVDEAEATRRQARACAPITEVEVLDGLMGLPVDVPVAIFDLTEQERVLLRRAPAGAIDWVGEHVVRRAVAPLSVRLALVAATDWRVGLRRAGRFTPYCARAVVLPASQAHRTDVGLQASFFGIGIGVIDDGARFRMLLPPRPYVRRRHTPDQWWFVERLYQQISALTSAEKPSR